MRMATLTVVAAGLCSAAVTHAQILSPVLANNAPLSGDVAREIVAEAEARAEAPTESSGPWGTLRVSYVYVSAPEALLQLFQAPSAVTRWTFVGMAKDEIAKLLDQPDTPAVLRADAADASRWTSDGDHVQFCPSVEAILALPPQARARLYGVLAQWEVNEFHHDPYFVPEGDVGRWIGDTGLRPELIEAVTRTAYRRGRSLCFSDLSLVVSLTRSHAELRALIKALSRTRTAILSLRVESAADAARIREYWERDHANTEDCMPLVESAAAAPAIPQLDIVHVLPPTARKLCYTFPHPSQAIGGRYPDCHWTSLNFFNYRPEERFFDTDGAGMFVREQCDPVEGPSRFGDILFFTDPAGRAVHSCVYLADDFVFTKNGANVISPWLIMKLPEVVARYSANGEPGVKIYRRRQQ